MEQRNIPVFNPGPGVKYVGSTAIPAGETKHFFAHELPGHLRPQPAAAAIAAPADPVDELLAKDTPEILEAASRMSVAEIDALGSREHAKGPGKARQGLLDALITAKYARIDADTKARDAAEEAARKQREEEAKAKAAAAAEAALAALKELQGRPVKDLVPALPTLSDEDLGRLEELEKAQGEYARKTVVEAIAAEILKRAGDGS